MRICMFTNTYLPHVGGVARSVSIFAEDLREAGHRVLIIAPTYSGYEEHDQSEPDIFRVPAIQKINGSDFSLRIPSPFLVDEQVDDLKPDIIHSHHPYLLGDAALRAARRRNLPLIFTHHTLYEEYTHYVAKNPDNMKRFAAFLSTNYANLCDRVVAPSLSIKQLIKKRGVTVPIVEIPTGVDTAFFSGGDGASFRKKHAIDPEAFVIGHLGRLAPEKNLEFLAKAVALALKDQPAARFLVAGEGPSKQTIQGIFEQAGLEDRLVMVGIVSGPTLAGAYQAMNLFAFASKSETQGMVLTEAMAAGVSVIALDASGVREVVEDGINGRLLDSRSTPERFAEMLTWAISEPEKMTAWIDPARETAHSFGRKQSAKRLLRTYSEVMEARREQGTYGTEKLDGWDKFLLAFRAEWDLVAELTESVIQAVDETEDVVGLDEAH